MPVGKTASDTPAIAIPFRVRLEPYVVESVCELSRIVRDRGGQYSSLSGLLFGRAEPGSRTVEALKTFADTSTHSELARRERWERSYKTAIEESQDDPELSALDVVGWFSFRSGSGLISSDIVFHNQFFRKPEDLALIVWREGVSQITTELYSRAENEALTSDEYRWGSVRLSADIRHMRDPVELAMRVKNQDESFLRTYQTGDKPSQFEALRSKFSGLFQRSPSDKRNSSRPTSSLDLNTPAFVQPAGKPAMRAATASAAAAPATEAWQPPAATSFGAAPAPARTPEPLPEYRPAETRFPIPVAPPAPLALPADYGDIGRAPRARRVPQAEVSGVPMVLRPPAPRKTFPWPWAAALFVLCSGLVFAFLALGGLQPDGGRIGQAFQSFFPSGDLNLKVRNEDDRLRLSWNQRNHTVASASDATLQIFDGQQHREVHLDGRQVADGSVLYRPLTNDVTFRLEVRGDQGAASGSVRVLDGLAGRQSVLDVSAPLTPTPAPAAADPNLTAQAVPPAKDTTEPKLIRTPAPVPVPTEPAAAPPITDTPVLNPAAQAPRTAAPAKPRPARYETPETIGTLTTSGGTVINGWDTPATSRSRKPRTPLAAPQTTAPPAAAPITSAASTGYVPPRPLVQVIPDKRAIAPGTIQSRTRVEVQANVDQTGHVSNAHVVSAGVGENVSSAALAAARQWTFDPASNNGQHIGSEYTIVFEFWPQPK